MHEDDSEKRYKELFEKLDINKDGKVELDELVDGLQKLQGVSKSDVQQHAQKLLSRADADAGQDLDFKEFAEYLQGHEQKLQIVFADLDRNKDGEIDPEEVQAAFLQLGVQIDPEEAQKLTTRIDADSSLKIEWSEWRDFYSLYPADNKEEMLMYWRNHSMMLDIGERMSVPHFTKQELRGGLWWRYMLAGGVAGAVARTTVAPIDRLKVILQVNSGSQQLSLRATVRGMLQEGGVRSLWRGNGANVLKIAPESALAIWAYEMVRDHIEFRDPKNPRPLNGYMRFAIGAGSGVFSQFCVYPIEVIKTRLAVTTCGQFTGVWDCGLKVLRREGFAALYRGALVNLLVPIPYAGIETTVYEALRQAYDDKYPDHKDKGMKTVLACGALSATAGQFATYPFSLLRTKLQARVTPCKQSTFIAMARDIVARHGWKGLYRGAVPNFCKLLPAVLVSNIVYEKGITALGVNK